MNPYTVLVLAALISGCASQPIYIKSEEPGAAATLVRQQHFYFMGLGQERVIDAKAWCKDLSKEVQRVDISQTSGDVALSFLTLGIYTPKTVKVFCR